VVVDPLSNRTTSLFDAAGHLTGSKDANGNLSQYLFDAAGRQTVVVDALSNRTTSFFDAAGNLTGLQDASNNHNLSTFAYDADNRVTSQTDALGHTGTFLYNGVGLMTSTTDRDGRVRTFSYDADQRKTGETWVVSGSTVNTLTFSYDGVGNMLTAANNISTYTMTFDADNRVTVVNEPFAGTLTFSYDNVGNRTGVQDAYNSTITTSVYDAANQLTTRDFTDGTNPTRIDLTYTATHQISTEAMANNLNGLSPEATVTFLYDAASRITSINNYVSGASVSSFLYNYDAAGRLTGATENGSLKTYTYDTTNQLTGDGTNTFTYDGAGNRTNTGYSTNAGNELASNGTYSFTYDNEGNEITKTNISTGDNWTYGYDNKNEMTSAVQKTLGGVTEQSITYKYDALGNRIEKDVTVLQTTTTRFAYDGWKVHLDALDHAASYTGNAKWDVWADLDGSNNLLTRYFRGDMVDQLFARLDTTTRYWEFTDREGSIRTVIDSNSNVKDQISYDGWGNATQSNSTYAGRYLWTGREFDTETTLQYNRARSYDPASGRWLSQDPLGFDAGDTNLYRYIGNNPFTNTDPAGLWLYPIGGGYKGNLNIFSFQGNMGLLANQQQQVKELQAAFAAAGDVLKRAEKTLSEKLFPIYQTQNSNWARWFKADRNRQGIYARLIGKALSPLINSTTFVALGIKPDPTGGKDSLSAWAQTFFATGEENSTNNVIVFYPAFFSGPGLGPTGPNYPGISSKPGIVIHELGRYYCNLRSEGDEGLPWDGDTTGTDKSVRWWDEVIYSLWNYYPVVSTLAQGQGPSPPYRHER